MNKLPMSKRVAVVSALVEGVSLRSICRMTGVAMNTALKLLAELGDASTAYHDTHVRGLNCRHVQADEIWSYIGAKQKNVTPEQQARSWGDAWTWTAIDADSKLIVSFLVGKRTANNCYEFIKDVASRLTSQVQLTTDGFYWYIHAVDHAFGIDID